MRLLMARLLTDNKARGVSIEVDDAGTIGHQATVVDAVPLAVHRQQARLRGERSDVRSLGREHRILEQDQRLRTALTILANASSSMAASVIMTRM